MFHIKLFLSSEVNALKQLTPEDAGTMIVAASESGIATTNPAALQAVGSAQLC